MQGRRVFDRFGFNLPKTSSNKGEFTFLEEYAKMVYNTNLHDWQNYSGSLLTGYLPDSDLDNLLRNNIDTELE